MEENASYPVRAVTLSVGSRFRFGDVDWEGDDYGFDPVSRATVTMQAELFDGLKTKEYGDVTGQILFGCIDAAEGYGKSQTDIHVYTTGSGIVKKM